MSNIVSFQIAAHDNIYKNFFCKESNEGRKLLVEIGIPDVMNEETSLLVFVPGYGGNMNSKIYHKMRVKFPDLYKAVTVQCDYFGNQYMGMPEIDETILEDCPNKELTVRYEETIDEFNDMGVMQALDVVYATIYCTRYLKEKQANIKIDKIILFGTSHGAYICHLANLICPHLYSWLIDINAYIKPYYMEHTRNVYVKFGIDSGLVVEIEPFLKEHKELQYADRLYDLSFLYQMAENQCRIIAFQGEKDWMVNYQEKKRFIDMIGKMAEIVLIGEEDVDGALIRNTNHGLGADFLLLFEALMPMLQKSSYKAKGECSFGREVILGDKEKTILISNKNGFPVISYITI